MVSGVRKRSTTRRAQMRGDFHALIRDAVREEIRRLVGDPDYGSALRVGVASRLARSQRAKRAGKTRIAQDVAVRLGLRI